MRLYASRWDTDQKTTEEKYLVRGCIQLYIEWKKNSNTNHPGFQVQIRGDKILGQV